MNNKQTAVELLKQRLIKDQQIFPIYTEYINGILYDIDNELLEMEKQQVIEARVTAPLMSSPFESDYKKEAEQYYNETFNK
jgi:ABC-type antimicrobial peptide transport system ATPase subunit